MKDLVACHRKETLINWQRRNKAGTKQTAGSSKTDTGPNCEKALIWGRKIWRESSFCESGVSVLQTFYNVRNASSKFTLGIYLWGRCKYLQKWPCMSYQPFLGATFKIWRFSRNTGVKTVKITCFLFSFIVYDCKYFSSKTYLSVFF